MAIEKNSDIYKDATAEPNLIAMIDVTGNPDFDPSKGQAEVDSDKIKAGFFLAGTPVALPGNYDPISGMITMNNMDEMRMAVKMVTQMSIQFPTHYLFLGINCDPDTKGNPVPQPMFFYVPLKTTEEVDDIRSQCPTHGAYMVIHGGDLVDSSDWKYPDKKSKVSSLWNMPLH